MFELCANFTCKFFNAIYQFVSPNWIHASKPSWNFETVVHCSWTARRTTITLEHTQKCKPIKTTSERKSYNFFNDAAGLLSASFLHIPSTVRAFLCPFRLSDRTGIPGMPSLVYILSTVNHPNSIRKWPNIRRMWGLLSTLSLCSIRCLHFIYV